jgi:hypothetical protein
MKRFAFLGLVLFFLTISQATVIGDLAAAMPERTFVKVPTPPSLQNMDLVRSTFAWNNSAVWDPVKKEVRQICAAGTCCSNGQYFMVTYDDATNTWKKVNAPFMGSGHAYDGNALNPATGYHYFGRFHDDNVRTWNGYVFGMLPPLPISAATTPACTWFPEINNGNGGLVYIGTSGRWCWWDGQKWTSMPTLSGLGTYNTFVEYHPVHKVVWAGAGNGGDRVSYRINANLQATKLNNAPISLNNHQSVQSYDPSSGKYVIFSQNDNSLWEFDIISDTWNKITNATGPRPSGTTTPYMFQVPIDDYGVIMYLWYYYDRREIYLYKHTKSSSILRLVSQPGNGFNLQVQPNPCRSHTTILLQDCGLQNITGFQVFNAHGRLIQNFKPQSVLGWNVSAQAPGIYYIRVNTGKETYSKPITILR